MAEASPRAQSPADAAPGGELLGRIEALRTRGAARFDAVGWGVIEAMLRRVDGFRGAARTALLRRIERRLANLAQRFERAGSAPPAVTGCDTAPAIDAAPAIQAAVAPPAASRSVDPPEGGRTGSPPAVALADAQAEPVHSVRGVLADLLDHVARHADGAGARIDAASGAQPATELKSLRYFRSTWSRLSLEQQLARALAQAPDNAGPLNSHFLVLQALIRMRDIAPQYLEGFIAHVDALFWLERADPGRGAVGRGAAPKAGARKGEARARGGRTRRQSRAAEG